MEEANLSDVMVSLQKQKWLIAIFTVAGLLAAMIHLHSATYKYTVSYNLTPASPPAASSGTNLSQIIGIGLPTSIDLSFELFKEGLTSEFMAEILAGDEALMHKIFDSEWDASNEKWKSNVTVKGTAVNFIKAILGAPTQPWEEPSKRRMRQFLIQNIRADQSINSSIATISIETSDAEFGVQLLIRLHEEMDKVLRVKSATRKYERMEFIKGQIASTAVTEYRAALVAALIEETKAYMRTQGTEPYVAEPFGPPETSFKPTSPIPSLILLSFPIAFFLMGVVFALVRERPWAKSD